jgi:hypothetical protein
MDENAGHGIGIFSQFDNFLAVGVGILRSGFPYGIVILALMLGETRFTGPGRADD